MPARPMASISSPDKIGPSAYSLSDTGTQSLKRGNKVRTLARMINLGCKPHFNSLRRST